MLLGMLAQPLICVSAADSKVNRKVVSQQRHTNRLRALLEPVAKTEWPECDGIGCDDCKTLIEGENASLQIFIIPENTMVTADYREDRVRIFCLIEQGTVLDVPRIG